MEEGSYKALAHCLHLHPHRNGISKLTKILFMGKFKYLEIINLFSRRLTNSDNFPGKQSRTAALRRHHIPPSIVDQGDFSIEENLYVANGQARYVY